MIRNIVFDMGQVLIRFQPPLLVERLGYTGQDKETLLREVFGGMEWMALDRGRLSPAEGIASMSCHLPERLHAAAEALVNDWWKGELIPVDGMAALIAELRAKGYGIYMLSNATEYLHEYFPRIPGSQYFDGIIVSADWNMLKPQHEIYELLFSRFVLRPEECFFIDDSPANIDGAACVGMAGTVFYGDMSRLRRELNQAGVAVKSDLEQEGKPGRLNYYGSELVGVHAVDCRYSGIETPQQLYLALRAVWCWETCSPSLRADWTEDNMTLGQCSITALLAQDIFGGEVYGMHLPDGAVHCYNVVGEQCFDLTSEQFGDKAGELSYQGNPRIDRDVQLADPVKSARYQLLKDRLLEKLSMDKKLCK